MIIDGQTLKTSSAHNIHSCGPQRVQKAIGFCLSHLPHPLVRDNKVVAYDPLCGNGVIPAQLRANFSAAVSHVFASDASQQAVDVTRKNLHMFDRPTAPEFDVFRHNTKAPVPDVVQDGSVHLVVTDPPYGHSCHWVDERNQIRDSERDRAMFLETLFQHLDIKMAPEAIVGLITSTRMKLEDRLGNFEPEETYEIPGFSMNDARRLHIMKRVKTAS